MAKILIAEDDIVAQKVTKAIVEDMGHTAFVSPDGEHALKALTAANDFSLLITDVMMPDMDGRTLIRTLRSDAAFKGLPIVIISAVVGLKEIAGLLELGATYFVGKPLDRDELQGYVHQGLLGRE